MKNINVNMRTAHRIVSEQADAGNDVRWDGWTMIFFRPADHAIYSPHGAFRNGVWGFENRVEADSSGKWEIDRRNLKRT